MQLITGTDEPLAEIECQWFGGAACFHPSFVLPNQVGIDISLVREIVGNSAVNFFQPKDLEILADGLCRFAPAESMDDGIQRNSGSRNVVVAIPFFDVFFRHAILDSTPSLKRTT